MRKISWIGISLIALIFIGFIGYVAFQVYERFKPVNYAAPVISDKKISDYYDTIVIGTDPEGVSAAISAARNGLSVLLLEPRPNRMVLGGLITLGWLNSIDFNRAPVSDTRQKTFLNKGLFQEFYDQTEGTSLDVKNAAYIFHKMVRQEDNIAVQMRVEHLTPIGKGKIVGVQFTNETGKLLKVKTSAVIDATQDGDFAAESGAKFTFGQEDLGRREDLMAVSLVFKLKGVTPKIWKKLASHPGTGFDKRSIWGYQEAAEYKSSRPDRVALRGLNIGLQNDNTILINSMQIFDVNPLDPNSLKQAFEIGNKEAPRITTYLKENFTEFQGLSYAGTAPELYVRESRHLKALYQLKMVDLMENRDHWDAIAYGSYPVDIQRLGVKEKNIILMTPKQYGIPFRSLVPKHIDGLLVVGRTAGFNTLSHGSARVIPTGIATGQAAGVAVKIAKENKLTLQELANSREAIEKLREMLQEQKVNLFQYKFKQPNYLQDKDYEGLLSAVNLGIATGGYTNQWQLDHFTNFKFMLAGLQKMQAQFSTPFSRPITDEMVDNAPEMKHVSLNNLAYYMAYIAGLDPDDDVLKILSHEGWISLNFKETCKDHKNLQNRDLYRFLNEVLKKATHSGSH